MKRQKDFFKYIMVVMIRGFVPLRTITLLISFCRGCPIWWASVTFTSSRKLQVVDAHNAWWRSSARFKSELSNFISNYKNKIGKLTFKRLVTWYNLDGFVVIPLIYETLSVPWFVGTQNSTMFAPLLHTKSIEFLHFEQLDWYKENILWKLDWAHIIHAKFPRVQTQSKPWKLVITGCCLMGKLMISQLPSMLSFLPDSRLQKWWNSETITTNKWLLGDLHELTCRRKSQTCCWIVRPCRRKRRVGAKGIQNPMPSF